MPVNSLASGEWWGQGSNTGHSDYGIVPLNLLTLQWELAEGQLGQGERQGKEEQESGYAFLLHQS